MRKPFQGVWNIIRFNWHFYALALLVVSLLFLAKSWVADTYHPLLHFFLLVSILTTLLSLLISSYVYDFSGLYTFNWLNPYIPAAPEKIVNIHAGFDETSESLARKFAESELRVLDFYDPKVHTEISIKRARKAYPPYPGTQCIQTQHLPLKSDSIDVIFLILAAHEIRNQAERDTFFQELRRILKTDGKIVLVEHLRDLPNFIAYTIGFFHFYPKKTWLQTFKKNHLRLLDTLKITPFIRAFILNKHANTP